MRRLRQLETAVAAQLGLAMLFSEPAIATDPACLDCLNRLAAYAHEHGPVDPSRYRDVSVHITVPPKSGDIRSAFHGGGDRETFMLWLQKGHAGTCIS
jgi:hypothetical protein